MLQPLVPLFDKKGMVVDQAWLSGTSFDAVHYLNFTSSGFYNNSYNLSDSKKDTPFNMAHDKVLTTSTVKQPMQQ